MKKDNIIICPTCGAEYLLGEIYIPTRMVGVPEDVVRDKYGKLLSYDGVPQDLIEEFECEYCNVPFKVSCNMRFNTKVDSKKDFSKNHKTSIKTGLNLEED